MRIPQLSGNIKRRLLINYRVEPEVIQKILPNNFRPKLHKGYAIAGVCLIRLENIKPDFVPEMFNFLNIASENTAHRIAVEWDTPEGVKEGVFIPRRDTDSRLNALAGGRIFPGVHHLSRFEVSDEDGSIQITVHEKLTSNSSSPLIDVMAEETDIFPTDSVFSSLDETSKFFENGCIGYSSRPDSDQLDGMLLEVPKWIVSALEVTSLQSSYFDNQEIFPKGSITFDHALLMRDIQHQWITQPTLYADRRSEQENSPLDLSGINHHHFCEFDDGFIAEPDFVERFK